MTTHSEQTASDFVHKGPDGRWYVCTRDGSTYYTPAKDPRTNAQYYGPTPDPWGFSYVKRADALRRARDVYMLD